VFVCVCVLCLCVGVIVALKMQGRQRRPFHKYLCVCVCVGGFVYGFVCVWEWGCVRKCAYMRVIIELSSNDVIDVHSMNACICVCVCVCM